MKKVLSVFLCIAILSGCLLAFAGCGKDENDKGAVVSAYYVGGLYNFDPAMAYTDDDAMKVLSLIYEPLFTMKDNGGVKKALADSYEIVEDEEAGIYQLLITIKETYWSDGSLVTADDVAFAWKRILSPDFKSQAATLLYEVKNAVAVKNGEGLTIDDLGIIADGDLLTITFEGKIDYDAFLRNLTSVALSPLRESVVSVREDSWAKRVASIVVNGPFRVKTLNVETGEFTLERNQYYRREPGSTTSVDKYVNPYQILTQWQNAVNNDSTEQYLDSVYAQFVEGTIFYMGELPLSVRGQYKESAEVADLLSTKTLIFNMNESPVSESGLTVNTELWSSVLVRQAMSLAIDRNAIANKLTFARPANGFISYGVYEGTDEDKAFRDQGGSLISTSANLDQAREYLQMAGINPAEHRITVTYRDTVDDHAVYEIVKAAWESLGFTVVARRVLTQTEIYPDHVDDGSINTDVLQDTYMASDFDVILIDYQMLSTDAFAALSSFSTTMNGNGIDITLDPTSGTTKYTTNVTYGGFSNADYDALIQSAFEQKDLDRRAAILHNAEKALLALMPVVPLVFNQNYYVAHKDFKKLEYSTYGYVVLTDAKLKDYEKYLPTEE